MTKVCKLLIGGLCTGDTFHYTPLLNRYMEEGVTEFIWWTGSFERPAVEFLCRCYPIQAKFLTVEGEPSGGENLFAFKTAHSDAFESVPADISHTDYYTSFNFTQKEFAPHLRRFRNVNQFVNPEEPACIVVQAESRNNWKNSLPLGQIDWAQFGLPVYSAGRKGEAVVPGSIPFLSMSFAEVATKVLAAKVVVSIHSAIACFTFYTYTPLITCHADGHSYLRFSDHRPFSYDLFTPSTDQIVEKVKRIIAGDF